MGWIPGVFPGTNTTPGCCYNCCCWLAPRLPLPIDGLLPLRRYLKVDLSLATDCGDQSYRFHQFNLEQTRTGPRWWSEETPRLETHFQPAGLPASIPRENKHRLFELLRLLGNRPNIPLSPSHPYRVFCCVARWSTSSRTRSGLSISRLTTVSCHDPSIERRIPSHAEAKSPIQSAKPTPSPTPSHSAHKWKTEQRREPVNSEPDFADPTLLRDKPLANVDKP